MSWRKKGGSSLTNQNFLLLDGKKYGEILGKKINDHAFFGQLAVKGKLVIPPSVEEIGNFAFAACKGLTSLVIPASVEKIGNESFSGCTGLISIEIPSVSTIGKRAFFKCTGLTSLKIPSVVRIDDEAFAGCTGLTSVKFEGSVNRVGKKAFAGCSGLQGELVIPHTNRNPLLVIEEETFAGCTGLTSLKIPSSITEIHKRAFAN
jgi:hypothetical protein